MFSVMHRIAQIPLTPEQTPYEFNLSAMPFWLYNPFGFKIVFKRPKNKNVAFKELRLNYLGDEE
jgi:hypothetical protein